MLLSVVLAQIFGIYFLLMAIVMVTQPKRFKELVSHLQSDNNAVFLASLLSCFLGITLVVVHTYWAWNWRLLITCIAWLTLIKSLLWLVMPDFMLSMAQKMYSGKAYYVGIVIMTIIGIFLLYHGYSFMLNSKTVIIEVS